MNPARVALVPKMIKTIDWSVQDRQAIIYPRTCRGGASPSARYNTYFRVEASFLVEHIGSSQTPTASWHLHTWCREIGGPGIRWNKAEPRTVGLDPNGGHRMRLMIAAVLWLVNH